MTKPDKSLIDMVLKHIPADGTAIGNITLKKRITNSESRALDDAEYHQVRKYLVGQGILAKGGGKGGSVRRIMENKSENHDSTEGGDAILQLEREPAISPQQTIPKRRRQSVTGKRASEGDEKKNFGSGNRLPASRMAISTCRCSGHGTAT